MGKKGRGKVTFREKSALELGGEEMAQRVDEGGRAGRSKWICTVTVYYVGIPWQKEENAMY